MPRAADRSRRQPHAECRADVTQQRAQKQWQRQHWLRAQPGLVAMASVLLALRHMVIHEGGRTGHRRRRAPTAGTEAEAAVASTRRLAQHQSCQACSGGGVAAPFADPISSVGWSGDYPTVLWPPSVGWSCRPTNSAIGTTTGVLPALAAHPMQPSGSSRRRWFYH